MTALSQRAEQLATEIRELETLRRARTQVRDLRTVADALVRIAARLRTTAEVTEVLRAAGLNVPAPAGLEGFVATASELRARFQSDPAAIAQGDAFDPREFERTARTLDERARRDITAAWEAHVAAIRPSMDHSLLDVLARIQGFDSIVTSIRTRLAQVDRLASGFPSASAPAALHETVTAINEDWSRLASGEIPAEVQSFLRAVGTRGGAPLSAVTPTVKAWLENRSIHEYFRVKLG